VSDILDPATAPQPADTFLPEALSRRQGMALCLSGGGFRAALFHMGALRRLNELGILSKIDTIASVSGGSITAAHIASRLTPWPSAGTVATHWDDRIERPFRDFTSKDLRTGAVLRRAIPWNWFDSTTGVKALEGAYEARLTRMRLPQLPERPRFVLCATDMAYGVNWVFERTRIGDYQAGYMTPPPDWPVARAVAASSCFPPLFDPLPLALDPRQLHRGHAGRGAAREATIKGLRLCDGGVYDNMGLEPVWKDHAVVLVSDGGSIFPLEPDAGIIWRLERYVAIQGNQAEALRKRWLISNFKTKVLSGTYWGVGGSTSHYPSGPAGYSHALVAERISNIRTDLDAFSDAEAAVLENHGYLLTDAAVASHAIDLVSAPAPVAVPNPQWMDEARVRDALKDSRKRKLPFGRS
jgi:NTE family protein